MSNGYVVSDWDEEACGYTWIEGKDVLTTSEEVGADIFDLNSMRLSIIKMKGKVSSLDVRRASNFFFVMMPSPKKISINTNN